MNWSIELNQLNRIGSAWHQRGDRGEYRDKAKIKIKVTKLHNGSYIKAHSGKLRPLLNIFTFLKTDRVRVSMSIYRNI